MICLGLLSIKPAKNCSQYTVFKELCHSDFLDISCLDLQSYLYNMLEILGPLSNQAESIF
jgi:hypothetical protein